MNKYVKTNNQPERSLTQPEKFQILHRDGFKCRYCGASPGGELLEVDHLIPVSHGGSDNACNLVSSCKACNRRRSDQPLFPHDMIIGGDNEGWDIIKTWGIWSIKACKVGVVVAGAIKTGDSKDVCYEYWFYIERSWEMDWVHHISHKHWPHPHKLEDFIECIGTAREMTIRPVR